MLFSHHSFLLPLEFIAARETGCIAPWRYLLRVDFMIASLLPFRRLIVALASFPWADFIELPANHFESQEVTGNLGD